MQGPLKRLALALVTLAATAGLVGAVSFALFSSTANGQSDTFAAGTVSLGQDPESFACNVTHMAPGDSTSSSDFAGTNGLDTACNYVVKYTGSLPAWIGLDVSTNSIAGSGGEALLDGNANGLQVLVTDALGNVPPGGTFGLGSIKCVGAYPTAASCSSSDPNQLLTKVGGTDTNGDNSVNNGWSDTFTVNYGLPLASPNAYQGGSAHVILTAHAVQATNNPIVNDQPSHGWS